MNKPGSVIRNVTTLNDFFRIWLISLKQYHKLTDRQIDLAAAFLKARYELSKKISDESLLDENVMSENTRKKVKEDCGCSNAHFQVMMGDLKKSRFFIDNRINPKYIPNLNKDNPKDFTLMFWFVIKDE